MGAPAGEFEVRTGRGGYHLRARCLAAGPDLVVVVTGGEAPHVGAVAAAAPRPSLADPARQSADASVLCFAGHKEDDTAKALAKALAARLNRRVVVCAGMHWDGLGAEGIRAVLANAETLAGLIAEAAPR